MNDQTVNTPDNITGKTAVTIEEMTQLLHNYLSQAEASIKSLEDNITNANNQVQEWKKMQFMIIGQRQLLKDLLTKTTQQDKKNTE